jgi:hypothetical protein
MNGKSKPKIAELEAKAEVKAEATWSTEIFMIHGAQPDWNAEREPKPDKWAKGSFQQCSEDEASNLVKGGHAKRVSDMSDEDLAKAGYGVDASE